MASMYKKYEQKGEELIKKMKENKLLNQICVEGHGDERHDGISDASLMDDILNGKKAASSFYPGLYEKVIKEFIEQEAPVIAEFVEGKQGNTLAFHLDLEEGIILGEGYVSEKRQIHRKSSTTAAIVLCLNDENDKKHYNPFNHVGFTILTAYPEIVDADEAPNIKEITNHDMMSVIKNTERYKKASSLERMYLENILRSEIHMTYATYAKPPYESIYIDIPDEKEEHHIKLSSDASQCEYSVSDIGSREKKRITDVDLPEAKGKKYAKLAKASTMAYVQKHFPEEAKLVIDIIKGLNINIEKSTKIHIDVQDSQQGTQSEKLNKSLLREKDKDEIQDDDQFN